MCLFAIGRRATDDNMVKDFDADDLTGLHKLAGDADIFTAWIGVSAGMVMTDDYGGGTVLDGTAEHFARVNKGGIEQAKRDKAAVNDLVAGVQIEDDESLLRDGGKVGALLGGILGTFERDQFGGALFDLRQF